MADAGDRISQATRIRVGQKTTVRDAIGTGDTDFFRFNLRQSKSFNLQLKGLGLNADVELVRDRNRNQQIDAGEIIASSRMVGSASENIRLSQLEANTYFLRVFPKDSGQTRYQLILKAQQPKAFTPEEEVWRLVNQERAQAGLPSYALNMQLSRAAELHSKDMAVQDYFNHTGLDGSTPSERVRDAGYPVGAGENIAVGYSSADTVMEGWMNSPGHRANILDSDFSELGVGYYFYSNDTGSSNWSHYWTQTFSNPDINFI